MKESTTYQAILEEGKAEGKAEGTRKMLLLQGREQFGEPSAKIVALLDAVTDTDTPAGAAALSAGAIRPTTPLPSGTSGLGTLISAQVVRPSLEISFGLWVLA